MRIDTCTVRHSNSIAGRATLNSSYGNNLRNSGRSPSAIEPQDPDGDLHSNAVAPGDLRMSHPVTTA